MAGPYAIRMLHRPWRFIAMALMVCAVWPAMAAGPDCGQMLASTVAKKPGKDVISDTQRQLAELGFDAGGVDGMLGSKTRSALLRFCVKAQFALNGDLLVMLLNHAAIYSVYPDWTGTLASKGFLKWAERQSDAAEIDQTRQGGDSASVIALLDRYQKRRISVPRPISGTDDPVSYMLTKDDFEQLRSRETVFKLLGKLLATSYAGKDEFEAAASAVLKGVSEPEQYVQLAEKYGRQQTSYRISAKSFDDLKVENIPEYILQSIQGIKDLNYPAGAFEEAVEAELGRLAGRVMEFKPELVKLAEITPSGASLNENSLAKFAGAQKGDSLAAAILERLGKLKEVKYKDDKALAWAMQKILMEVESQINNSLPAILAHAEEATVYVFGKDRVQEVERRIKELTVPEVYLEMMAGMQDVDYPDAELFWLATKARVAMAGSNNTYRRAIRDVLEKHPAGKVDESLLDGLKAKKLPPALLALLGSLQGREFGDARALEDEIDGLLKQLSQQYDQYRQLVIAQARKTHPFDKTKKIQWSGVPCNCLHNNLAGIVYGLYPYWMAGENQAIDFSVQTRIGYYGLSFDDKGNLPRSSRWSELDTGFIREARSYGTKVDLVVYRDDWRSWEHTGSEEKSALFENLASNIAGLVGAPLTDFFSGAKPYISLGMAQVPVMGDGVTLYFSGYPQDAESVGAFGIFISKLRDKLSAQGRPYSVNIMFRSDEMGKGIYDYPNLMEFMRSIKEGDGKLDSLFLVLLQEPSTRDKKELRSNIEKALHGKERMRMQGNVAMVITYDGHNEAQLTDDVIYAEDEFGGIGFWTQPVASGVAEAPTANSPAFAGNVLHANYLNTDVETGVESAICQFVCPNRWAFRIAWGISILALLASFMLYLVACDWRNFFDKHFMHFIAGMVVPALLLTFALLFCDPAWEKISRGNGILIFVVAAILAYSIWSYHDKKRKADLP